MIQNIVNEKFDPDVTTYAGVWRKYINPIYPMSYKRFLEIINMTGLKKELRDELARQAVKQTAKNQILLFTDNDI